MYPVLSLGHVSSVKFVSCLQCLVWVMYPVLRAGHVSSVKFGSCIQC